MRVTTDDAFAEGATDAGTRAANGAFHGLGFSPRMQGGTSGATVATPVRIMPLRPSLLALALCTWLLATRATADGLDVRTIEYGSWSAAVAALQGNIGSQGREIHVFVHDEQGRSVRCGDYSLALDPVAAAAFHIDACTAMNGATALRLVDRHALFAHDDLVPTPRQAGIVATQVRTGHASGGVEAVGGSEVHCTVAVRPYLNNLETGERLFLDPGRFQLRVRSSRVSARAATVGWMLTSSEGGTLTVDYDVVDTQRGTTVVRDRATLSCGREAQVTEVESPTPSGVHLDALPVRLAAGRTCHDAPVWRADAPLQGDTMGGAFQPFYRVDVPLSSTLDLQLDSSFGGEIELYAGCDAMGSELVDSMVFGGGTAQHIRLPVTPGVYFLAIVDGDIRRHTGGFVVRARLAPDLMSAVEEPASEAIPESDTFAANCMAGRTPREGVECLARTRHP